MSVDSFVQLIAGLSDRPVAVYGAGLKLTDAVLAALRDAGIVPACLCDGREQLAGTRYAGFPVLSPAELRKRFGDSAYIVICPSIEYWAVYERLWNLGMTRLLSASSVLEQVLTQPAPVDWLTEDVKTSLKTQSGLIAARGNGVFLPMMNIILTERCTLNCRLCCNLTPLLPRKRDYPVAEIAKWLSRLLDAVDAVGQAHIIGGEAFLHNGAAEAIRILAASPSVHRVCVVANGTLLPSPDVLEALRQTPNALVFISNYGKLSVKLDALKELLHRNGIPCADQPLDEWRDIGDVSRRERTAAANRTVFENCMSKNCGILLNGRLHRCSRSAFGARLGAIPDFPGDYVDFSRADAASAEQRDKVRRLFFEKPFLDACDYCNGVGVDMPAVKAAEQAPFEPGSGKNGCGE